MTLFTKYLLDIFAEVWYNIITVKERRTKEMYKVYCHSFDWVSARSQNLNKKFKKNQLTFAAKCGIINIESEADNID